MPLRTVYMSVSMVSDIYASEDCLYVSWVLSICPLGTIHLSPCSPRVCPSVPLGMVTLGCHLPSGIVAQS